MINTRAANRYAKAFLSITKSEDDLMIMFKDMSSVIKAFEQSQELKLFIDSKVIKDTDKLETLKKVFPDLSAFSTNLLDHITNSGRIDLFDDVAKCFVELYLIWQFRHWEKKLQFLMRHLHHLLFSYL